MKKILIPIVLVLMLMMVPKIAMHAFDATYLLGIVVPYAAFAIFLSGFLWRILRWVRTPVPFNITTTVGQQKSLPWIKRNAIENPATSSAAFLRLLGEVFLFRSLFRNTKSYIHEGRLVSQSSKWLWVFGLAFHYTMLVVVLRHLRFFAEVVPLPVHLIEMADGMLDAGPPAIYLSGLVFAASVGLLFLRRLTGQMKILSQVSDYFPLLLLLGIALSGLGMRYVVHADIPMIREQMLSMVHLQPVNHRLDDAFYVHLFLVSVLFAYFPFSKLVHAGGIVFSPTRNMANNARRVRHINPWDYPVPPHSYAAYEDDFRQKMLEAGLPVESELFGQEASKQTEGSGVQS